MDDKFTFDVTVEEREKFKADPERWVLNKLRVAQAHSPLVDKVMQSAQVRGAEPLKAMVFLAWQALVELEKLQKLVDEMVDHNPGPFVLSLMPPEAQ